MGKKVGKLIKAARTAADMTQAQLARRVTGLTDKDISLAERGEKDLTQTQLKKIATVTGVTQASLLNAAKEEKGTAAKKAGTAKSTAAKKPKTPSNANTTMKVTATEKKLIEAYRLADSDARKQAMAILKGEETGLGALFGGKDDLADTVSDVLEDVLGGILGGK